MPRVPTYDNLQVEERGLPGARQESAASALTFGAPGAELIATGKGMQSAGAQLAEIAGKIQDRENVDVVFRAETALKDDLIKHDAEQRAKRGAAALADGGVTQQTEKWFGEAAQRHSSALSNPAQQRAFSKIAEGLRLSTLHSISNHQAQEARVSVTDSTNAAIVGSINRAAANANDWTVAEAEAANIRQHVAVLGKVNGHDQTVQDAIVGEKLTALHTQMIQQLVRSNPAAVKAYYEKYEKDIDGSKRAELGEYARKATATSVGDGAAEAVWKTDGPKSRTDPVKLADMEARLRTELKGNDEAIKVGIAGLRERVGAYRDQRKEEANALEASVNGLILNGTSMASLRKSPAFLQLSTQAPEEARKILTFMEGQAAARESRAASAESRAYTAERRAADRLSNAGWGMRLKLQNPEVLARMSTNEVTNLLPLIGPEHTSYLLTKHESISKNADKLADAKMDKRSFDAVADSLGLNPYKPHKTEDEARRLGVLHNRVEEVLGREQAALGQGKKLTDAQKEEIMRREMSKNLVGVGRIFDTQTPAITVLPQDYSKVTVPKIDRTRITAALQKHGLPVTDKAVVELYLRGKEVNWTP